MIFVGLGAVMELSNVLSCPMSSDILYFSVDDQWRAQALSTRPKRYLPPSVEQRFAFLGGAIIYDLV